MGTVDRQLSAALAAIVPEHRRARQAAVEAVWDWGRLRSAVGALSVRPTLLLAAAAVVLASLSGVVSDDEFVVSLITKRRDARMLAPLSIADDLIGIARPLIAAGLARSLGATRLLSVFVALEALAVTIRFANHSVEIVPAL